MTRLVLALLSALCLVVALPGSGAAQHRNTLVRMSDDDARIRAWIEVAAAREHEQRMLLGGLELSVGVLSLGGGVTVLAMDQMDLGLSPTLGVYSLAIGAAGLGLGIYQLAIPTSAELRVSELGDQPLTERTIGRLEGQLRHAAEQARAERILFGIYGGAITAGAIASGIYLGATGLDPGAAPMEYAIMGGIGLIGLVFLVTTLFESPAEGDWREYQQGLAPAPATEVSFRLTPSGFALTF